MKISCHDVCLPISETIRLILMKFCTVMELCLYFMSVKKGGNVIDLIDY